MTQAEQKSVQDIQGTPGFRVIEFLVKQKIADLKDISNIDETLSSVSVESQALGRKYGMKLLEDFFSDMGIYQKPIKETNKTYE